MTNRGQTDKFLFRCDYCKGEYSSTEILKHDCVKGVRRSKKHVCDYRDCLRMAVWKHCMCPAHGSAGRHKPESRGRSGKTLNRPAWLQINKAKVPVSNLVEFLKDK